MSFFKKKKINKTILLLNAVDLNKRNLHWRITVSLSTHSPKKTYNITCNCNTVQYLEKKYYTSNS